MNSSLKKILLIDDDRVHLFTLQKLLLLSQKALQLTSFRDGREAFLYLQKAVKDENNIPDIILLDISMPGWDGWKFLLEYGKLLPRLSKKIKLYIVSTSSHPEDIEKALRHDCVSGYFTKPMTIKALNKVFEQCLIY